jgi:hypothetical protein
MSMSLYGSMKAAVPLGKIAMMTVSRSNPRDSQTMRKPQRHVPRRAVLAAAIPLACTLVLAAGPVLALQAYAPNTTPARIGNIWGGFDHQPTESQVQSAERAYGVAPTAQEQRREAQIVQQLNQELLKSAGADNGGAAAG